MMIKDNNTPRVVKLEFLASKKVTVLNGNNKNTTLNNIKHVFHAWKFVVSTHNNTNFQCSTIHNAWNGVTTF